MTDEVQKENGDTKETPEAQRGRGAVSRWVGWIAGVAAAVVLLLTLLAYLGDSAWWLDVLNQGRMQYLTWSLVLAVVLLLARAWPWLAIALVAAAIRGYGAGVCGAERRAANSTRWRSSRLCFTLAFGPRQ